MEKIGSKISNVNSSLFFKETPDSQPQPSPILKNKKTNLWITSVILLFTSLITYLFVFLNIKKQRERILKQDLASRPTILPSVVTPVTSPKPIFPIKVHKPNFSNKDIKPVGGHPAPCQPNFFDPKINKFYKVKQNGIPSELYKIKGFDEGFGGVMMINGWYKEGENKINLPSPFKVTIYQFGCASSFSFVIDLSKNNIRQALYTHVLHYSFSEDGKYLFLINNINNQNTWTLHKRIINLETKESNEIPNIKCVSELDGFWQADRLLTYAERKERPDYGTDICIWDKSGNLISRIDATTAWGAASRDFLAEKIGLLPNNPNIFYTYTSKNDNTCSLFLADIRKINLFKTIDILNKDNYVHNHYYCAEPEVEFDFSALNFSSGRLKYRIEKNRQPSGQIIWNKWQIILNQ